MTGDRAIEALDGLRERPVVPPAPAFADALERRLRDEHPGRDGAAPASEPGRRPRPWRVAAIAAAAVLVVGLAVAALPDATDRPVVMTAARHTSLVLPDGEVVEATAGLELAEGTIIVTGDDGSAEVDGVAIGPSRVAVVTDDDVVLLDPARRRRGTAGDRGTTTTGAPPPSATAPPTDRPPATTTTTATRPQSTSTTTTTTTAARPSAGELRLTAERIDRQVVALRWSSNSAPAFDRYVVVRTLGDDGSGTTVFTSRSASTVAFRDELPAGTTTAAYRVLALDGTGEVIAASPTTGV